MGATKEKLRVNNKRARKAKQADQVPRWYWQQHTGEMVMKPARAGPTSYRNEMAPANLALYHSAADLLLEYATKGCPTRMGKDWSFADMEAAVLRGPHPSALQPDALAQL